MITIRINGQGPRSETSAFGAEELESYYENPMYKLSEQVQERARKQLREMEIAFFEKPRAWTFLARSGEKISLPAGWYTKQGDTLHRIIVVTN